VTDLVSDRISESTDRESRATAALSVTPNVSITRLGRHRILAANLHKEAGMSDESDTEFSVSGEARCVCLAAARSHRRVAHKSPELPGALTKGRIAKRCFDHPKESP